MPINTAALDRIKALQEESRRLVATLDYYAWLESQGLSWDMITHVVVAPVPPSYRTWVDYRKQCKRRGIEPERPKRFIEYKLRDGSKALCPWPPFENNVIYNKPINVEPTDTS